MPQWIITVLLLLASNAFMTFAWYYHVKRTSWPLVLAVFASWGIAFFEYCLMVPANRYGHIDHGGPFTLAQLKIIQEAITLIVFTFFAIFIAHERPRTNDFIAFVLILAAVAVSMAGRR